MSKVSLLTALRSVGSGYDGAGKISLVNQHVVTLDAIPENIANKIHTLFLSNNHLSSLNGIAQFKNVTTLSISYNNLSYLDDLSQLEKLRCLEKLSVQGNIVALMPHYRDFVISMCPKLLYFDNIKVSSDERRDAIIQTRKLRSLLDQVSLNELHRIVLRHFFFLRRCHIDLNAHISPKFR